MNTYLTEHSADSLGRWLATLAVSLVLLALAYAQASDPAGQLGLASPSARTLANSQPVPDRQRGHRLAPSPAPVLASAQLRQPLSRALRPQFAQ